jgi:hypothetical protein
MCDHCHPLHSPSRRDLLKAAALASAALLTACQPTSTATPLPLPDEQLEGEAPKSPIITDTRPIIVPPPVPPKRTDYGDILPRRAWTAVPMEYGRGRPMNGVQRITIHHSGDGKPFLATSVADTARHLQSVQRAHFQRGMIDIAYHFAIDRAGRAWQLRSLLYEGQHVRIGRDGTRWNEHNLGIVTLGDFNLQSPTTAQFTRLLAFVRLVQQKYALPVAMIRMHGELVQTDCPGQHLAPLIRDARNKNLL